MPRSESHSWTTVPWPGLGLDRVSRTRAAPVLCYKPLTQLLTLTFSENDLFHKHIHCFIPSQVSVFAKTQALGHFYVSPS